MRLGECYMVKPELAIPEKTYRKRKVKGKVQVERLPMKGKIVWVHPLGRFAVLEFEGIHGNPRECFYPDQLLPKHRVG